jgi:adenine C2-methylase RlmN of 23S rRNA A2503 and tRNA A37
MDSFITDDGTVAKFIHDDGSETAVKVTKSCSNFLNPETGFIDTEWVDRNKYTVFISASLGCYMACKFCHLTIKNSIYRKLRKTQVVANVKEALLAELARKPEMKERYVKLCWMGMGDAVNQPEMVYDATLELLDWIMENGFAKGLDCVDLSTVLPKVGAAWIALFRALNDNLARYPDNPDSCKMEQAEVSTRREYTARSRFRLFYSVHSAIQATRDRMIPNAMPLRDAIPLLLRFQEEGGPNLLLHSVFVENLNDGPDEITALLELLRDNFANNELRILRYNFCDRSPYREIDYIDKAVSRIAQEHPYVKVQTSAGKEVAAACGQFLVAFPKSVKGTKVHVVPVPSVAHVPVVLR